MDHKLLQIAEDLNARLAPLKFSSPVEYVYNPARYARDPFVSYCERFGNGPKEALFLGMNPGPWGMAQTGIPFGEIASVRDWMKISGSVGKPVREHAKRKIEGFACKRSEVSGRRLWGWASDRFESPEAFFDRFFVINYCPLIFLEQSGRNKTPDKIIKAERTPVLDACNIALKEIVAHLQPKHLIGVGKWAEKVFKRNFDKKEYHIASILHPSPASPAANRGWAAQAEKQLLALGISLPK